MVTRLDNLIPTVEAARLLGVSETTIRSYIASNRLNAYQLRNNNFLIEENALNAFQENRQKKTTSLKVA